MRPPVHESETICPFCGYRAEVASPVPGASKSRPEDGDASLCIECGEIGIFDGFTLQGLRKPNDAEQRAIDRDPGINKVKAAWRVTVGSKRT